MTQMSAIPKTSSNAAPRPTAGKRLATLLAWTLAPLALGATVFSLAQTTPTTPPNIPPINIAHEPLHAATQGDKPALALALSVEFPTVGAQYNTPSRTNVRMDESYSPGTEYIGYYNTEMCYTYKDAPSESPAAGETRSDYKRFVISGPASGRRCNDAFSGNFLNWASSSAIDMLRLALSGGDRVIDKPDLTILQRALLPNGDPSCFWNSQNFPAKRLPKGGNNYAGAVPNAMIKAANGKTIWVANTLNRIYFRADDNYRGSCTDTSGYTLTSAAMSFAKGSTTNSNSSLPSDATRCAAENGTCNTGSGVQEIWYGANDKWNVTPVRGSFTCNNDTFGDPVVNVVKACYSRPYNGSWSPPLAANELNSDGFFYSRVEVCNADASGRLIDARDYNFCFQYPKGNFKPTGVIQKYSNRLRLAAFGYALDQPRSDLANGRYGGVLRAPMKYVGYDTYDEFGVKNTPTGGNPSAEWDVQTGVFFPNPLNDTTFNTSGVINYLNKFGRTHTSTPGVYKQHDPASELYYEALRYLQGLPPSAAAVERLDMSNPAQMRFYDGFPIYTDWTSLDPYGGKRSKDDDYSCLKSNIAFIGDVNTHDSKHYGNERMPRAGDAANNIPDIYHWLRVVQSFEQNNTGMSYSDGSGIMRTVSNPNGATPGYAPHTTDRFTASNLIGLAYWARTHDIRGAGWTNAPAKQRPGLRVKSFFFDVNEYGSESDVTKRRTRNQYYMAAKYGGFFTNKGQRSDVYNTQGNPFYDQNGLANNDVWQDQSKKTNPDGSHTHSRPLEPESYFLQSNARGVLEAFEKIFGDAATAERSIAGASTTGSSLTQAGLSSYQASYDTENWTGDVQEYKLSLSANDTTRVEQTKGWSAQERLDNKLAAEGHAWRKIFVGKRDANPSREQATEFTTGQVEADLKADLGYDATNPSSTLWEDRLNYLRGDKNKEGSPFRVRDHMLADIVNSGARYIGAPSTTGNMSEGRAEFAGNHANRTSAVYVGANDGMLHAFDAKTGDELFAYIPSWMGPKLSALTDPGYQYNHQAYVDATPVIGDAKTGSGSGGSDWKTVLVSGTGGGGRGVFALDVTDPAAFDASKVMWEFTHLNDPDMGFVIGKSRIVRMRVNSPSAADGDYRWFAMVPSGVNNYVKDTVKDGANPRDIFSATGAPTIFLLALDKPTGEAWKLGENYYKISLPFDATLAKTKPTGIITLEAMTDRQGTGTVEYVYAGDLHGNVWALDFTGAGASDWTSEKLSKFVNNSGDALKAYPMYIAKDAAGNIQPISAAPTILRVGNLKGHHVVGIGTGKYIEPEDASSKQPNTYYALYDNNERNARGGTSGVVALGGRDRLQKVVGERVTMAGGQVMWNLKPERDFEWGRATSSAGSVRSGWYYDLPDTGERVIYDSTYIPLTTKVQFSSLVPAAAGVAAGVCGIAGGSGHLYDMDLMSGIGTRNVSTIGLLGQPIMLFNAEETQTSKADSTGRSLRSRPVVALVPGSGGMTAQEVSRETIAVGRLSWRQINNYLELKKE